MGSRWLDNRVVMSTQPRSASSLDRRLPVHLLAFERLLAPIHQDWRFACIQAPAGYGKTSLLTMWRQQLVAHGWDVALVRVPAAGNLASLADAIITAVADIDRNTAQGASYFVGRGVDEEAIERLAIELVRGIQAYRRPIALFLDECERLEDPCVLQLLQWLIDYAPSHFRLVAAGRSALALSVGRLRAAHLLLVLGQEDLRLRPEEATLLLRAQRHDLSERDLKALCAQAQGWPAGLRLLAAGHGAVAAKKPVSDVRDFGAFFEREVLRVFSSAEARLLVLCAVPATFVVDLVVAMAGAGADAELRSRVGGLIARLEQERLFIEPIALGEFRMHPLLREVLLAKFDALDSVQRVAIDIAACDWFAEAGRTAEAVHHAIRAGEHARAATLVESVAEAWFARGELHRIVGLVHQLSAESVTHRPGLQLWLAWGDAYELKLADCSRRIAELVPLAQTAGESFRLQLTLLRGLVAVQADDTEAAASTLSELQESSATVGGIAVGGRRNILSWLYIYRGEYQRARDLQSGEGTPLVAGMSLLGTPFGTLAGRCFVGLSHAVEGRMVQAERIYRDVLFEAERLGPACAEASFTAAGLLGEVLYEMNDPQAAAALLEERVDVLERVSMPDTVLRAFLILSRAYRLQGRSLDAMHMVERLEHYAKRLQLDRPRAYALLERLQLHLAAGKLEQARECLLAMEALEREHPLDSEGVMWEVGLLAERARVHLTMFSGDIQASLQRLVRLIEICRAKGRLRRLAALQMQAACLHAAAKDMDRSYPLLLESLRLGHKLGLIRALLDVHPEAAGLVRDAMGRGLLDPLLGFYADRLTARDVEVASREPVVASAIESLLNDREMEIVRMLAQAMPNKKIARALGLSLDTIKWYLKNIYAKLAVSGRDEAVERLRAS